MVTLLGALVWIIVLFIIFAVYWYVSVPRNLPPGPIGLPYFGSMFALADGPKQDIVLQEYVKKYGPLLKVYICNKLVIILGDYETIYEALVKQGDAFAGRIQFSALQPERLLHKGIVSTEGPIWKEQRRFALSTLRDLGIGRPVLEPQIREVVESMLSNMAEQNGPFNPLRTVLHAVSTVVYALLFGPVGTKNKEKIVQSILSQNEGLENTAIGSLSPAFILEKAAKLVSLIPVMAKLRKETEYFIDLIEQDLEAKKASFDPSSEPDSYVHAFMKAADSHQSESFTNDQLLASAFDMFVAGTNTTTMTTVWSMLHLCHKPEIQEKMYAEIRDQVGESSIPSYSDRTKLPFTEAVIMEVQRICNLLPLGILRRTVAPVKLMGYDIPEDAVVAPLMTNVFWNPDYYPNPHDFNPYRFLDNDGKLIKDPKIIPFQLGKRICIGESLARMEVFLFITGLVSRFRMSFPSDKPLPSLKGTGGFANMPRPFQICMEIRRD